MLSSDANDWLVITGDGRIQKNAAERLAYRQASLRGLVLAPSYQKTPLNQTASFLIWRWPDIEKLMDLTSAPSLFELPMHRSARIRTLPV
jgi:hypothetical protein